jgi:hypothetical protein
MFPAHNHVATAGPVLMLQEFRARSALLRAGFRQRGMAAFGLLARRIDVFCY